MKIKPERALQWWDDLDDLVGVLALRSERIRHWCLFGVATLAFALLVLAGILLAFVEPPLALATTVLLLVVLMYRAVTERSTLEISA